jgi:hypothetical protein
MRYSFDTSFAYQLDQGLNAPSDFLIDLGRFCIV